MRRGFSQIELLVAVAVVAMGFLSLLSVLLLGFKSQTADTRMEDAVKAARQVADLARARDLLFIGPSGGPVAGLVSAGWVDLQAPPFQNDLLPEGFERSLEVAPLSTDPGLPESRLTTLRVSVRWFEQGQPRIVTMESWVRRP